MVNAKPNMITYITYITRTISKPHSRNARYDMMDTAFQIFDAYEFRWNAKQSDQKAHTLQEPNGLK